MTDATAPWMGLDRDAPVHHVGYGKVEELIAILAARITASEFDAVVGISRSGIVPATMLSNRLGKELYLIRCQRHCEEVSWMGTPPTGKSLLIVDDIVSRGETMRRACEHLNRSGYAVKSLSLFVDRTRAAFIPDFALDAPGFVRFAWDRRDTTPEARRAVAVQEMHPPLLENECLGVDMDGILLPDIRKAHYALLPVWMLHTRWNDKDFLFAMNGQTGKLIGDLPVDPKRVAAWFAGISLPLMVILALFLYG